MATRAYPFARCKGYSLVVSREALNYAEGRGVLATSRTDNGLLMRLGFHTAGTVYPSGDIWPNDL